VQSHLCTYIFKKGPILHSGSSNATGETAAHSPSASHHSLVPDHSSSTRKKRKREKEKKKKKKPKQNQNKKKKNQNGKLYHMNLLKKGIQVSRYEFAL